MPDAPTPRGAPGRGAPPREAARPLEPAPDLPRPSGALPSPADPRLAPRSNDSGSPARLREEAAREAPAGLEPADGAVEGVNPDRAASKPRSQPKAAAPRSAAAVPAAKETPIAERPTTPAAGTPAAEGPRRPVRVIGGVTPMNGGEQATPGPQNGVAQTPAAGAK